MSEINTLEGICRVRKDFEGKMGPGMFKKFRDEELRAFVGCMKEVWKEKNTTPMPDPVFGEWNFVPTHEQKWEDGTVEIIPDSYEILITVNGGELI